MNRKPGVTDFEEPANRIARLSREARYLRRLGQDVADRAAGFARWRNVEHAVAWFVEEYRRRSSARGLAMNPDPPTGGADTRVRDRQFAAVVAAVQVAERDDAERNPRRVARIRVWIFEHFEMGAGRSYAFIAEGEPGGWTEVEVSRRVERAVRVIRKRLRDGGWMRQQRIEEAA